MTKPEPGANVVAVEMGMGHLRAAYPLRHLSVDGVLIYGSKASAPASEYKIWRKILNSYYFFSRAGKIPLIGKFLVRFLEWMERIEPYYPRRDCSRPNFAVKYLDGLIERRGLCGALIARIHANNLPVIHTYFATAIATDRFLDKEHRNYLVICDSDFNRVWVPKNPLSSNLRYIAPCAQVKRRLLSYGVHEEKIFLTGFPLPRENIGTETGLELLKKDLFDRLMRLDPSERFFQLHRKSVMHWLAPSDTPPKHDDCFTVTFAIGGAGAQTEIALAIMQSLGRPISEKRVRLIVSAGTNKGVFEAITRQAERLNLPHGAGKGLAIVHDAAPFLFLDKFNSVLRTTDVLWTKPSELVFYSGLGLPILMAPPIGAHEELNSRWLNEVQAGVSMPGPAEYCGEWLFDLHESGKLADAAWAGFLNVRKLGAFKIERLIGQGMFDAGSSPLER
jgi:hypothetical protein